MAINLSDTLFTSKTLSTSFSLTTIPIPFFLPSAPMQNSLQPLSIFLALLLSNLKKLYAECPSCRNPTRFPGLVPASKNTGMCPRWQGFYAPEGRCSLYKAFIRPFLPMLPQVGRLFVNIASQHNSTNYRRRLILTIGYIPLFESNRSLRIIWFYVNFLRF